MCAHRHVKRHEREKEDLRERLATVLNIPKPHPVAACSSTAPAGQSRLTRAGSFRGGSVSFRDSYDDEHHERESYDDELGARISLETLRLQGLTQERMDLLRENKTLRETIQVLSEQMGDLPPGSFGLPADMLADVSEFDLAGPSLF